MRLKYTIYILFSLLLLFFCSKSDQTYTIETKDGVKYVHNLAPTWGDTLKVALEFVQQIGELEGEDENYLFYRPNDIERDADENLYILDNGNCRIQKFDKHGKYLATIGRQGQGPGEFIFPMSIHIGNDGNLYIPEKYSERIKVISPDGKELKRFQLLGSRLTSIRFMKNGFILTATDAQRRSKAEDMVKETRLMSLFDEEGNFLKEFGKLKDYNNDRLTYYGNTFGMALDKNDTIYVAFYEQNRIEKYSSDGKLIFQADRPLNYELEIKDVTNLSEVAGEITTSTFPEFTGVSRAIGIDYKNRLWIKTYKKQKEEDDKPIDYLEFEIFNSSVVLLGKVPVPQAGSTKIIDDRVYFIDTLGEMVVYEYRIVEK